MVLNKIHIGNALEILKTFPDASINMCITSPPYWGLRDYKTDPVKWQDGWLGELGTEPDFNAYINHLCDIFDEVKRVLKDDGTIWISGTNHSIYKCGYILEKLGFYILNDIVWYKPNAAPNLSCKVFTHSHETILWAKKNKNLKHYYNYDLMKNMDFENDKLKSKGKQMRSVWSISSPSKSEKLHGKHPTQKPL